MFLLAVDASPETFFQAVLAPVLHTNGLSAVQAQLLLKLAKDRPTLVPRYVHVKYSLGIRQACGRLLDAEDSFQWVPV
jgi:hypothetical protein